MSYNQFPPYPYLGLPPVADKSIARSYSLASPDAYDYHLPSPRTIPSGHYEYPPPFATSNFGYEAHDFRASASTSPPPYYTADGPLLLSPVTIQVPLYHYSASDADLPSEPSTRSRGTVPPQKGRREFQCERCPRVLSKKCAYENHLRTHTGKKPFLCLHCGTGFAANHNCLRHMRTCKFRQGRVAPQELRPSEGRATTSTPRSTRASRR